jgi:hypothetical protein
LDNKRARYFIEANLLRLRRARDMTSTIELGRQIISAVGAKANLFRKEPGSACLIGFALRERYVTEDGLMPGAHHLARSAIFMAVSVSDAFGLHQPDDTRFLHAVAAAGGIACFANNVGDVLLALEE